ncbi:hypothetical protein NL108_012113 [Boleophthalmus pectinirostris]|nr:hypothetical protein NL108_012113 [Boleophthalmus pectinirostris]
MALAPLTAGVSLYLTAAGAASAVTTGVNSVVTTVTDHFYSKAQKENASENFKKFMTDVDELQTCLKKTIDNHFQSTENIDIVKALSMTSKGMSFVKNFEAFVDGVSVVRLWRGERAAGISPELSFSAIKGPRAMTKTAIKQLRAVNVLFIGMDVLFIAHEGMSLSWGSETETSKWIRARAALWRSEVNSLQRINDSLEEGQKLLKKKHVLQEPFYSH